MTRIFNIKWSDTIENSDTMTYQVSCYLKIKFQFSLIALISCLTLLSASSQIDTVSVEKKKLWKFDGTFAFNLNESTFSNWVSGGNNQVTTTTILRPVLIYDNNKWSWETDLDIRHGLQKIESNKVMKSEDVLRLQSKVGRRISKKWKFSGMYILNTQARPSYDGDVLKSSFMSPGYTNLSVGFDYNPVKSLSIYITPSNFRSTYVLNDTLNARGEFGVEPGSSYVMRFGPSFLISYKDEVFKNILVDTKLGYFQNLFDKKLGDPVVNWDAIISLKVNKFIATTFTFAFFYDKESKVDVKDENGVVTGQTAKIQFKQSFGFGLNLKW
jgi:hypothetical protein